MFKISYLISLFLLGATISNSLEARGRPIMPKGDERPKSTLRHKRPPASVKKELSPEGLVKGMRQQLLGIPTAQSADDIDEEIRKIYGNASSPTSEQIKEIRALNRALDKALPKFTRQRNAHRIPSRNPLNKGTFAKPPVSSKKVDSLGIKKTNGTIRKKRNAAQTSSPPTISDRTDEESSAASRKIETRRIKKSRAPIRKAEQAPRTTRNFVRHKKHWETQRSKRLRFKDWASKAYSK